MRESVRERGGAGGRDTTRPSFLGVGRVVGVGVGRLTDDGNIEELHYETTSLHVSFSCIFSSVVTTVDVSFLPFFLSFFRRFCLLACVFIFAGCTHAYGDVSGKSGPLRGLSHSMYTRAAGVRCFCTNSSRTKNTGALHLHFVQRIITFKSCIVQCPSLYM